MPSVKFHWVVLVLVVNNTDHVSKFDVTSIAHVPAEAPPTFKENPDEIRNPLRIGGAGKTASRPSVSQPVTSASCAISAKRRGRPFVMGFCTPSRSLYCPAGRPGFARLSAQTAFVPGGSEESFQGVVQTFTSLL